MKKNYYSVKINVTAMMLAFIMVTGMSFNSYALEDDTINMGAGYANDVYFSMENGTVATVDRSNWDIAFSTSPFSAAILINDGAAVELYTYPNGDTSAWSTMDTSGLGGWTPMYNTEESWEEGAFNINASNHPDYGWGVYNAVTHNVVGDSLYIIKTVSGDYKKLWIVVKESMAVKYTFRYASLDGTSEEEITVDASIYSDKNFIYYSIASDMVLDREPVSGSWDLLMTKYMAIHPTGPYVLVTGVLNNYNTFTNKYEGVSQLLYTQWSLKPFDTARAIIGWNWKTFDFGSFTYIVDDSAVFFTTDTSGQVFKLYFTEFQGTSTGITYLKKELISAASINEVIPAEARFSVFPNPSNGLLDFQMETFDKTEIAVFDISGNLVFNTGTNQSTKIDLTNVAPGTYIMLIKQNDNYYREKLIIQ